MTLPEPYYRDDANGITLYCGDCLELLPLFEPGSVDLSLTDPPYGVAWKYDSFDDDMTPEQWQDWIEPRFLQMRRVSATVLITGQARLPQLARIEPWAWLMQWWKPAAMGRSPMGVNNWEPIAVWGKMPREKVNDVIRACVIPDRSVEGHPCPKPLQWALGQLDAWKDAETVLDPFAGSGTTLVACLRTGRRGIGIEISREYCEIAAERLRKEKERTVLFDRKQKPQQRELELAT